MSEFYKSSPENSKAKFITLDEARSQLEAEAASFVPSDTPGTDGGRTFHSLRQQALDDPEALQVYVDTWNSLVRQQMEMDAGF